MVSILIKKPEREAFISADHITALFTNNILMWIYEA
jgi:hypothetical protein